MAKNKPHVSLPTRRRVLRQIGALSAFGLMPGLSSALSTRTAASAGSYKALVCVFLYGGNDANNMVVPTSAAEYATYLASRGGVGTPANGALGLPAAGDAGGILPLTGSHYGLHPAMPELQSLWDSRNVALLFNVGNLVQPFASVPAFLANADATRVPVNLYSHIDQQHQMQVTSVLGGANTGWAGRIADTIAAPTNGVTVGMSAAGNSLFLNGATSNPIVVPQKGTLNYSGFNTSTASQARLAALKSLFGANPGVPLMSALGGVQSFSLEAADILQPILSSASAVSGNFPLYATSPVSQQLAQVALLIQAAALGKINAPAQQIFFVDVNGFDTHNNELDVQGPLLAQLSSSLNGFYQTMVQIGQQDNVVAFTLSDFARTLKPASGGGSDHAWGSHHVIVGGGGAVKAGAYGAFPNLALGGPSDVSTEGRWLPTTSIDQYGATLAGWLGVSAPALTSAFPNLHNFPSKDLGFLS